MRTIPVAEAVGTILCHDLTRIIPGQEKGPAFRKGHIIREEDIPALLAMGKEHLYVYTPQTGILHENEAALRIAHAVAGDNLTFSEPREGRINFLAACRGLLQVDADALRQVNMLGEIALATLHTLQEVSAGQPVAGTRIIPLLIEEEKIAVLESMVQRPLISVLPFQPFKVGVVTTGSEVYYGRIKDGFGPVLTKKFSAYGCPIAGQTFTTDDAAMTSDAIRAFIARGVDMVVCTGGMSVDPDDRTPMAIRSAADRVVSYGAPMFPGAMFMLAFAMREDGKEIPILGLPGCVMYHNASIFELIVPRLLAGLPVHAGDIAALGHGGFCTGCAECRYPLCAFGKF